MCFRNSRRRMLYSAIAAIPLLGLAVVYWLRSVPDAPPPFVLARCKDTKSDAPRVGVSFATQFEASPALFHTHAGTSDSPPIVTGIDIRPLASTSKVEIVYGSLGAGYFDAVPSLSEHSAEREVYRDDGQVFGKDSWVCCLTETVGGEFSCAVMSSQSMSLLTRKTLTFSIE